MSTEAEDYPITYKKLWALCGAVGAIVVVTVSTVWFAATTIARVAAIEAKVTTIQMEYDRQQAERDKAYDKLVNRVDATDRVLTDVAIKLERFGAVLERIDKQLDARGK